MTIDALVGIDYWLAVHWLKRISAQPSRAARAAVLDHVERIDGRAMRDVVEAEFRARWLKERTRQELGGSHG